MKKWTTEFPTEEGYYWFYGYRFGKDRGFGKKNKPELMFTEVREVANGMMYVANGNFMFPNEVEEPHFQKVELPEFPKMEDE